MELVVIVLVVVGPNMWGMREMQLIWTYNCVNNAYSPSTLKITYAQWDLENSTPLWMNIFGLGMTHGGEAGKHDLPQTLT